MRELGKFAALTAAITFVLFVLAVNLLEPGWDDQMLLGTALAGMVLAGLFMIWGRQKKLEEKLDQLLNEKRDQVIRSFTVDSARTLLFPYLKAGKYSIRLTEDINRNGLVDTGNLLEHKQPEKVKFYKLEDGNTLIDIPEMTELEQNIDVEELFK